MALTESHAPNPIIWTLGDYMYKARKDAKLEQKQVAALIGVSRALVSRWENDLSEPSYRRLVKFAEITNFPLDVLLAAIGYNSQIAGEPPVLTVIDGSGRGSRRPAVRQFFPAPVPDPDTL
jgi:transcriptional regulator with XRE-family HTH domain